MRIAGRRAASIAAGLLMLTVPVVAQEPDSSVTFRGVSFTIPAELGDSVVATVTPGDDPDAEGFGLPQPPGLVFSVLDGRREGATVPRIAAGPTVIRAYPIDALEPYPSAMRQVDALRELLDARPDLAARTAIDAESLPYLPATEASQIVRARPVYVDTPLVSGVTYLTAYEQAGEGGPLDRFPLTSTSVQATFQGLSADGTWYVSVVQDLETSLFPDEPRPRDIERAAQDWDAYLTESIAALEAARRRDFTPSLRFVNELVASLGVAPPPSPTPSASPVPSALPSPVGSPSVLPPAPG